jgi:hypothetical protein
VDDPVNGQSNGATPCWVILNLSNGEKIKLHHTFNVKHQNTYNWNIDVTSKLMNYEKNNNITFKISAFDPGADDLSFYLDFGDGSANFTKTVINVNQTFPVTVNLTISHNYLVNGIFNVTLIARDDDNGINIIKISIYVN